MAVAVNWERKGAIWKTRRRWNLPGARTVQDLERVGVSREGRVGRSWRAWVLLPQRKAGLGALVE